MSFKTFTDQIQALVNGAPKADDGPAPLWLPPPPSPMRQINPIYLQQQPYDALAPMRLLQQYRETGQVPVAQSSFTLHPQPSPLRPGIFSGIATAMEKTAADPASKSMGAK